MMYPLKIAAIDRKQGVLWAKQWHTINIVNVLDGADLGTIKGSMFSYSETSLWIVHSSVTNAVITARAVAKEKGNIFVLEVNASGLEDKGNDAPRCYKSRIPFPSNPQSLAHLEPSLKRLCESLKKALKQNSDNDVAIKQAWREFDSSAISELLVIVSPLALVPKDKECLAAVTACLAKQDCAWRTFAADSVNKVSPKLSNVLKNCDAAAVATWIANNTSILQQLARGCL